MNEPVSIKRAFPDTTIIAMLVALGLVGLALVYSAGVAKGNLSIFYKQSLFFGIGVIAASVLTVTPPKFFYALAYVVYVMALFFLGAVLILGSVGFGARRWLDLGFLVVQPSEPAKLALIIALSRLLADWRKKPSWKLVGAVGLLAMPAFVMILMQPDLGTSTVFPVICLAMLAWHGIPARYFLMLLLPFLALITVALPYLVVPMLLTGLYWLKRAGVNWLGLAVMILICLGASVVGPKAWDHLEPYQQRRLTSFIDPAADPLGSGYQVIQSQVAIGSGGFAGRGFCKGTQTQLRFLPQQHTDFIFSLAGEEFGFLGTSFILLLYSILIWRGYQSANQIRNQFMGLAAAGMTAMLFYHSVINIGMAMGNLPVTGLPLPFLSYGGTFLITCLAAGGVLLSASLHRRTY